MGGHKDGTSASNGAALSLEERLQRAEQKISTLLAEQHTLVMQKTFLAERIDALMNVHHAAILVIDPENGQIIDGNRTAITRYAHDRNHLLSQHISEINTLSRQEIAARMRQAVSTNRNHFEFSHRLLNGSVQDVDVYSGPIQYNGHTALISFIHDATRRKAIERKLKAMATSDALTGCCNRRHLLSILHREFQVGQRNGVPLTFAMLDVDRFKHINDTFGHPAGDSVLQALATTCNKGIRNSDSFGRLGGEEFGFILPATTTTDAERILSRIREDIEHTKVNVPHSLINVTVSIGITALSNDDPDEQALMSRADTALYAAKAAGRNRISITLA
ncbi:MAG: GGDEF domain-containing protein [Rhodospirillaceae bacterium]|nr:GGDEF domain-containing protein [Rhodospirillaceae bacterium]